MKRSNELEGCALRVGLVQDGTVICERTFRKPRTVTVGRSERNDLILFDSRAPVRINLFSVRRGEIALTFDKGAAGKVAIDDRVSDLGRAIDSGLARRAGGRYSVSLEPGSRGTVCLGEFTVLFQVVRPMRRRPRPVLPAAMRGGLWKSADLRALPFVLMALLFHGGLIAYWQTADWPIAPKIDPLVASGVIATVVPEPIWIDRDEAKADLHGEWVDEDHDAFAELKENKPRSVDRKRNKAERIVREDPRIKAEERAAVLSKILAAADKQAGVIGSQASATGLVFGSGPTGSDLERLIGQLAYGPAAREHSVLAQLAGGKNSGEAAAVDALRVPRGDTNVETQGASKERRVGKVRRDRVRVGPSEGFLDAAEVTRKVKRALPAIKGCYERALPRNPTLEGRLEVGFTVSPSGKVSSTRSTRSSSLRLFESIGRSYAQNQLLGFDLDGCQLTKFEVHGVSTGRRAR
ncbi:MAG: AgmX/PglI C-terminal domain-containing protein [Deltaproteobacteria bacterium]|nr:AgmX/PglI C-terminal domain-containing protein [Deltaproteobacteria bacterium]